MTPDALSPSPSQPSFRARLIRRLQRSDIFLIRCIQAAALIGCIIGLLIYSWQAVHANTQDARRALSLAAANGEIAAEADLARIDAAAIQAAPLLASALSGSLSPAAERAVRADVAAVLDGSPVTAIIVFDARGKASSVFGQLPSDAAGLVGPRPASQRAGRELLGLEIVPVSKSRAAWYRGLALPDGTQLSVAMVLRTSAFQTALGAGSAAGEGWRAALLNRDGQTVLTAVTGEGIFSQADANLAAKALGWRPLHTDESTAAESVTGESGETFIETRAVAGEALQIAYVGQAAPAFSILASRKFEFIALMGSSLLAAMLAISIIQNEWQRHDRHVRDADLAAARANVTCDLLAAGVIDWSVVDGVVEYSEGWADLFSQGVEPRADQIFDWIARIHADDRVAARNAYQAMLEGRETELVHRVRVRLSSGLWVQVIERGRSILSIDGTAKRIVLVQTIEPVDGSALRGVFEELGRSESRTG